MLETHLRQMYRVLDHKGYKSRIGWLHFPTKKYEEAYVSTEDEAVEIARKYDGTHNVFIGRAARNPDGSFHHSSVLTFDLDPIRAKDTASTDAEHKEALDAGRRILNRYRGGYLASSGNGALLVYRISAPITDLKHYEKEKVLIAELQEIAGKQVKVDATNYPTAVVKFLGTQSTKGDIRLRRCSQWLDLPLPPYRDCPGILQRLADINVSQQKTSVVALPQIHNGDRSVADFHLVSFIKKQGAGPAAALAALKASPYGRQIDEKDQERLISKIYKDEANVRESGTDNYFEELFTPKRDSDTDVRTGFGALDTALGPLPKGELTTFAARSGFGKTTWGCTLSEHWRKQGKRVLYFSTEMSRKYIMDKLVSLSCEIPLANTLQKTFSPAEVQRIRNYEQQLLLSPVIICDEFQPTIELVRNEVIKHKPEIVIFDHITQSGTHHEIIAQFTRALKDLTNTEGLTTIILSMLNEPGRMKDGTEAKNIRGDIRGSQEILFLSSLFCMFSNPYEVKGNFQPVNCFIAKNRYGISNQVVPVTVNKSISKFIERSIDHDTDLPLL